jgi:hypothetical protein
MTSVQNLAGPFHDDSVSYASDFDDPSQRDGTGYAPHGGYPSKRGSQRTRARQRLSWGGPVDQSNHGRSTQREVNPVHRVWRTEPRS